MTTGSTHPCHTGMTRRYLPSTFRLSDSHFITFIYYYDLYIYIYMCALYILGQDLVQHFSCAEIGLPFRSIKSLLQIHPFTPTRLLRR